MSRDTYIYTYTVPEEGKKHVGGPWCDTSKWLKAEGYLYESGMETNFNNQEFSDKYGNLILVGGLEHFLLSIIYGRILPIDFHIFQRGRSTTNQYRIQHRIPAQRVCFSVCRWILWKWWVNQISAAWNHSITGPVMAVYRCNPEIPKAPWVSILKWINMVIHDLDDLGLHYDFGNPHMYLPWNSQSRWNFLLSQVNWLTVSACLRDGSACLLYEVKRM